MAPTHSVTTNLRSLVAELRELREIKAGYAQLQRDHEELLTLIRGLAGGAIRRGPGRPPKLGRAPSASGTGRRFRSSAAQVESAYKAIAAKAPSDWKTREEICKAAGLKVGACKAAWKRATEGYEAGGKKIAAVLKSNGRRGTLGAYKAA